MRSQAKHFYLFLTRGKFINPKHLNIYQPFLNDHRNMRSISMHLNHYKKNSYFYFFFSFIIRKEKCQVYQQKKEKQNLILMIWFLEKNLICLSAERSSAESLVNKYKLFGTKSKQTVSFLNISKNIFLQHPQRTIYPRKKNLRYLQISNFQKNYDIP